jgi:hypothetical protein
LRSAWIVRNGEGLPRLGSAEKGLVGGQVGTIGGIWAPCIYEVEFCDNDGRTYAMADLTGEQLMRLHHEPVPQAA